MAKSPFVPPAQERRAEPIRSDRSAGQNTLRNVALICGREYKNQVTQKSFKVISIIYLALVIIGPFIPTIIQYIAAHNTDAQTKIVTINNAGSVAGMSGAALTRSIETSLNGQTSGQSAAGKPRFAVTTEMAAARNERQDDVKNGKLNILLVIERAADQDVRFTYYTTSSDPTDSNRIQVQKMAEQLSVQDRAARLHLSSEQVSSLLAQPQFTITNLQQVRDDRSVADIVTGIILAYVGVVMIFMAIMTYGAGVAQGVAEEKGSHIMEILVLAATPFQLMFGKIVGIGAAGLSQMAALVLVGIGMLAIQAPIQSALLGHATSNLNISITGASITMLLLLLLYFILAFTLYSSLYAAAGALAQRQDEARTASTPITLLFMVGYITSVSIAGVPGVPDQTWFKVMSYIPFWSPTMMLARIGAGTVAWWEIVMTVALMAITIPACAWISARIYRFGVLMYGQRFSLAQIVKLARA
jgi:ABC-2 type transport system permease protein